MAGSFPVKGISLKEALLAQKGLRSAAGLGEESFPIEGFVGMISDEIEALRSQGKSDRDIAQLIRTHSGIEIDAAEIERYYASSEDRRSH